MRERAKKLGKKWGEEGEGDEGGEVVTFVVTLLPLGEEGESK